MLDNKWEGKIFIFEFDNSNYHVQDAVVYKLIKYNNEHYYFTRHVITYKL